MGTGPIPSSKAALDRAGWKVGDLDLVESNEAFAAGFPFTAAGWKLAVHAPAFKYYSPMSAGSWGLVVFGVCSFASFLSAVWPNRWPGRWLREAKPLGGQP